MLNETSIIQYYSQPQNDDDDTIASVVASFQPRGSTFHILLAKIAIPLVEKVARVGMRVLEDVIGPRRKNLKRALLENTLEEMST